VETTTPPAARTAQPRGWFAQRFARLLPPLGFEERLEALYRTWHARHARERMRYTILPAMSLLLICAIAGGPLQMLRETLFTQDQQTLVDLLRFGVMVPTCIAMLLVTYTSLYARWLRATAQAVALLQGLCFVGLDLLMQKQGYSLSSWIPLVALSSYMMYGLLQHQAVLISAAIVTAYGLGGWLHGLTNGQRTFDFIVIAFASFMGFVVHYGYARAQRYNWFKSQLLKDSVHRDSLTGIANRRMFDDHIERLWHQAVRMNAPMALLLIDLDQFKAFNDHAGHQAGDVCLARVATAIARAARRPLDVAARYGGEEFVVLLYDVRRERVEELCRELHADVTALNIAHPASIVAPHVTVSIGAACVEPIPGRRYEGLVQLADEALYAAKEGGRHRTVIMDREYATLVTGAFRVSRPGERAA
jgi:diguanylate cyclase (GGDEF)-like protein